MAENGKQNPWARNETSVLEIYHLDTQRREILAEFDSVIEAPNWSRDGRFLLYNGGGRIYRFDLETRTCTAIDTGFATACNNDHVLSPDGRTLAISHMTREDSLSRIYTLPVTGGVPRLITPLGPSYLHGWSGQTLAYCAQRNGEFQIYTLAAEGGVETRLTDAPGLNDGPEFDPTGQSIWFNSMRTGLMQVWRMRADGSEQTQMTFDEDRNSWFPHVSPDGRLVVMLSYRKGDLEPGEHLPGKQVELRLMDASGGPVRTLMELFGGQGTINVNSWSPDSRRFAFVSYRPKQAEAPLSEISKK